MRTGLTRFGTSNNPTLITPARLASNFPDYDPLIAFAEIALDASNDWSIRIDCHKTIVAYVHPKIRTSAPVEQMGSHIVINIVNPHGDH
jgi:hypothetical protein